MRPMKSINPCQSAISLFLRSLEEDAEATECAAEATECAAEATECAAEVTECAAEAPGCIDLVTEKQNEIMAASFGLITKKEALARAEEEIRAARAGGYAAAKEKPPEEALAQVKEEKTAAGDFNTGETGPLYGALTKADEEDRAAREDAEKKALGEALAGEQKEGSVARQTLASIELLKYENADLERALAEAKEQSRAARENAEAEKEALEKALAQAKKDSHDTSEKNVATSEAFKEELAKVKGESRIAEQETLARINCLISENTALENALKDAQEEIRVANEASREIDLAHNKYISEMIYKLRTPLQSIIGFSKLLLDGSVTDESTQKEFLAAIEKQSEQLLYMFKELTEISNMQPARLAPRRKAMSIN